MLTVMLTLFKLITKSVESRWFIKQFHSTWRKKTQLF